MLQLVCFFPLILLCNPVRYVLLLSPFKMEAESGQEDCCFTVLLSGDLRLQVKNSLKVTEVEVALVGKPCPLREEGFG